MKSQPIISVLMGVYNGGKFLSPAINSILKQSFTNFEFIIIDDGSNDETTSILNSFNDHRLVIIRNSYNIGLTKSLNKGLQIAQGQYIARQDADDVSHHQRLAKQVAFLDSHPECVLVGCQGVLIDENGAQIDTIEVPSDSKKISQRLVSNNVFIHGSVTFLKSAIIALDGYRENFRNTQDYDLWLRLSEQSTLANLPDNLYSLRRLASSISMRHFDHQLTFAFLAREFHKERLLNKQDSYSILKPEHPELLFTQKFAHLIPKLTDEKLQLCLNYANESAHLNNYPLAYNWLNRALELAPSITTRIEVQKILWSFRLKQLTIVYNRYIGWRFKAN